MNKDDIWSKFNRSLSQVIVYAEASSIDCGVDCLYPESLIIGILTTGGNDVNSILLKMDVNLEKCLKLFKAELVNKKKNNDSQTNPDFQNIKISKGVLDICKNANKIREEQKEEKISVVHVFLSILELEKSIKSLFEKNGLDIEEFSKKTKSISGKKPYALMGDEDRKRSKSALETYCTNVTELARENKLDPIIAREMEIESAITILCRRVKSNPIFIGDPGVGKSAVVDGIAQRIVGGTVPKQLINNKLYSLSLSSLVAGTKYRGDFEERIHDLVQEIQKSKDIILFIDEIHTLIGAGSASGGALDASNILKPFLARSELKCIGATTLSDYKKYFQKDGALARRFQQVMIEEPTKEQMVKILSGIKSRYEEYHKCVISEDAIDSIINLTARYLPDKNFPDKAIDCMDMACAKFSSSKEDSKGVVIDSSHVSKIVSEQCQIPIEVIMWDDNERISQIEINLSKSIIGQKSAVDTICKVLKNSYSGIRNPTKPIGSFVFGGQSGTGKTHTAKQLAEVVFGKENALVRLDMSEFSESHSVSKLIGSPPGYVGFHETDVFTDKIKRKPYSIVLLDEIEKASPEVLKLFLQVMSDGIMTNAMGEKVDFKNVILVMTGNFGMNDCMGSSLGFKTSDNNQSEIDKQREQLVKFCQDKYGQEFINRVDEFVVFVPLDTNSLEQIAKIEVEKICGRLSQRKLKLKFSDKVFCLLVEKSKKEHGKNANMLHRIISKDIESCISDVLLTIKGKDSYSISVDVDNNQFVCHKRKHYEERF
jgi:ATP-dependent Clp protease ATP-binding subunit ClpA